MKKLKMTLGLAWLTALFLFAGRMHACNLSDLTVNSVTALGSGQYEISLRFCVGSGITGAMRGADQATRNFGFVLTGNADFVGYPASLTSPQTGYTYTANALGTDTVLYKNAIGNQTWACVTSTALCGQARPLCVDITFVTNGLPNSITALGAEANGLFIGGCNGNLDMTVNLQGPGCPVVPNPTTTDATCASLGSIALSPSGGQAPYAYQWSNGATTSSINNLAPGDYFVTMTDASPCTVTYGFTVGFQTTLFASGNAAYSCATQTGSIMMNPTGGTAPFTYQWNTGATTGTLTSLAAGTYRVTVTDVGGCTATNNFTISSSNPIQVNGMVYQYDCTTELGKITLNPSGGANPYTYLWNNGATTATRTSLTTGTYAVTVTDGASCTANASFNIANLSPFQPNATITSFDCATGKGSITLNPSGGLWPYNYQWSNGATTQNISNLAAGTYTVTINMPLAFCGRTYSYTVGSNPISANLGADRTVYRGYTPQSCTTLSPSVAGGVAPYTYNWSTGATSSSINVCPTNNSAYSVTVTDARGCAATDAVVVNVTDVRCGLLQLFVLVCHQGTTQCVLANSVAGHLNHGDQLGNCTAKMAAGGGLADAVEMPIMMAAWPVPAQDQIHFEVAAQQSGMAMLEIYNLVGVRVIQKQGIELQAAEGKQVNVDVADLAPGVYLARVTHATGAIFNLKFSIAR